MNKRLTVLSLFDGISGANVALAVAGFSVKKYYASEIDPYAISIAKRNFIDTIQLGDVTKWKTWNIPWEEIDLLIGGSPCTNLSKSGNGLGLKGEQSKLFWDFVDIWNHIKSVSKKNPYFVLENVNMRKKEWRDTMSEALGVEPMLINSNLVSAQNRERLYWTNIPDVTTPSDKRVTLKDILFSDARPIIAHNIYGGWKEDTLRIFREKSPTIRANSGGGSIPSVFTLDSCKFDNLKSMPYKELKDKKLIRELYPEEVEGLQTYPIGYTAQGVTPDGKLVGISKTQRLKALGNSFTVNVIVHILSFIEKE